ncbi:class I SAM-dependent methyltransferase [Anaerobacillus isosaccharinicus]|uniref:Class I SAM-dependent methyltransferase n=1 Tax=Anaerobacillus isosaccharinicus TaxID=1532552 RepID=A0A7S7L6J8_9BACI|nr:rRNA adenine N-6-methyltransferase family protein [Anaerobacillus isosaccharinicus]MBA5586432.1 methyltransferase [Anaerobacillus isosaccharinicus]QOY35325.1 methyltransferase [Anaerobacillus isosaccharinicus]
MSQLSFLYQFLVNPRVVGAIFPSSRFLSEKMVGEIDFKKAKYIVEYGAGTGVFTEFLMKKRNPTTFILVVENNKEFCLLLEEKFKMEKNLLIVNGSAEGIKEYISEHGIPYVDYVISGLPFASLPYEISSEIIFNTVDILKKDGKFITFQYTKLKKEFIEQFFNKISIRREYSLNYSYFKVKS